jgi:phosphatidylinositol 4-kinase type 2
MDVDNTDGEPRDIVSGPSSSSKASIFSVPLPRRTRSQSASAGGDFPPPIKRMSTDASGVRRPVPFSAKFQRLHPGTTGVTLLEHLERLDAVEASLQRLGVDESAGVIDEGEEVDVGEASSSTKPIVPIAGEETAGVAPMSDLTPAGSPEMIPHDMESSMMSIPEEDLAAMSKSMSHAEVSPSGIHHGRWPSQGRGRELLGRGLDFLREEEGEVTKKTVIVEVRILICFQTLI